MFHIQLHLPQRYKKTGCLTQGIPVFNTFFICRKLIFLIYPK
ncbi:unknown [Bacteroides sp. CAG:633]|nr:unknown [Bacteroides sp. CAG:633]